MATTTALAAVPEQRVTLHDPLALWHLLSLDAPTVAAVWTIFLAYYYDVALPWTAPAAVALAVWLIYATDRLQDARSGAEPLEERHQFHGRHARVFLIVVAMVTVVLTIIVILLPRELRTAWMLLGLPMMGYVAAVHVLRKRVPKESLVGVFFAAATCMPALLALRSTSVVVSGVLFGLLCWLNCVFIARSESAGSVTGITRWAQRHFPLAAALLLIAALIVFVLFGDGALAVALGAALLMVLDAVRLHDRRDAACLPSRVRVRALADAALLTPLLVMPLLRLLR